MNEDVMRLWRGVWGRGEGTGPGANHDLTVTVVRGDCKTPPDLK